MARTVTLRIAVAYDCATGGWNSCGWNLDAGDPRADDELMSHACDALDDPVPWCFITQDVDAPPGVQEIRGEVEEA